MIDISVANLVKEFEVGTKILAGHHHEHIRVVR